MVETLKGEFQAVPIGKVIFGPGTAVTRIRGEVDALGSSRALIVTGKTLTFQTELVERIKAALGEKCVGVFRDTFQHVPRPTVLAGARVAQELAADVLIVVGGSTPVDTAKGMSLVLAEGPNFDDHKVRAEPPNKQVMPPLPKPKIPIIAIPTTLSGSEFTHLIGITDPETGTKDLYADRKLAARAVILDPEMTVATGRVLWGSTGIKSLCGSIAALCSPAHHPYSDALALTSADLIFRNLPASVQEPFDLAERGSLLYATWLSESAAMAAGGGLIAGLRHQIGAMRNVPHGIASTIVLPHVIEFNRPYITGRLALLARAAGIANGGASEEEMVQSAVAAINDLVGRMELPTTLRDVGVRREDFDAIAEHVLQDFTVQTNPRPVTDRREVLGILENAY